MEFHPLADIFPMMSAEEFTALKADIAEYGLRDPIILAEGKVVDGRNRYLACQELGLEPRYEEWNGQGSLLALIVSKNLQRRHLSESQRAMVAAKIANMPTHRPENKSANLQTSQGDAAKLLSTSTRSVASAKKVLSEGIPELAQAVNRGDVAVSVAAKIAAMPEAQQAAVMEKVTEGKSAKSAMREVRHAEKRAQPFPQGKYQVIYIDPPWAYDNSGFEESADNQYPTMSLDDIEALPIESLATKQSILFLWATIPLLPEALETLGAWGFKYKSHLIWRKNSGPSIGWWIHSKHEILLIGVGPDTPQPAIRSDSVFDGQTGRHSQKPERAYEIIESMYHEGGKVELFSRNEREGWTMWGNEDANT